MTQQMTHAGMGARSPLRLARAVGLSAVVICGALLSARPTYGACPNTDDALMIHLRHRYGFSDSTERNLALSPGGFRRAQWFGLKKFFPDLTFYYFVVNFELQTYGLASVLEDCGVIVIEGVDNLGILLARQPPDLRGRAEAEEFARLLVKMINVSQVYGDGYADGEGILASLDEIRFASEDERANLVASIQFSSPRVEFHDELLRFHFLSWHGKTTQALLENILVWQKGGKVSYNRTVLKHHVGLPLSRK